jgi:CHAT domain-containing protein/tetratricopeptide (TPR) repeat protein
VGRSEEPAKAPRLTAKQQKQLQQAQGHGERAQKLWGQGKQAEAIRQWQQKLTLERAVWGDAQARLVPSLQTLAQWQEAVADFAGAAKALQEVLRLQTRSLGARHWQTTDARLALADLKLRAGLKPADRAALQEATRLNSRIVQLWEGGQFQEALSLARQVATLRGRLLGRDHSDYAQSLFNLGAQYQALGELAQAEALYRRSLQIAEARLGKDHPDVGYSLNNLGLLYQEQGRYEKAEPLYRRCRQLREAGLGQDHPEVATTLNNLAQLYNHQGQYEKAEPLFRRSLQIYEARLSKDHPLVAKGLNNLAVLYQDQGQYEKAEPLFRRSLQLREARLGKDHPDVANSLNNLGRVYEDQGQYEKAEPLFRRSLQIYEARLGKDHPDVAISLNNLAQLHDRQGQFEKAEPLFRRSLQIREARLGKDHPDVARSLNNLASVYYAQGRYGQTEVLLKRSLQISEARLGEHHPEVATCLHNLAMLYTAGRRWEEAAQTCDRARRSLRRHLFHTLPALVPTEQLAYLHARVEPTFHMALSLALERDSGRGVAEASAAWLVNGKGLSQQALAQPLLLGRAGAQPHLHALHGRLLDVRRRLARLTLAAPRPGQEQQRRRRLDDLDRQERQLTRELGQKSGEQLTDPGWVELAAVRQALPPDAVLIDIARIAVWEYRAQGRVRRRQAARYAAWVIPPKDKGGVRLIDLGEAHAIEAALRAVRQLLAAAPKTLTAKNEVAAEQRLRRALAVLAGRLLRPLAEHVGQAEHWIVSPDAALWLVPWAALPLADGSHAIEKHRLSFVVSGRDLVRPSDPVPGKGALVLADPDFDLRPARGTREGKTAPVMRGPLPGAQLPRFARLPGTAREARAIAPLLERYAGQRPAVRTNKEAREETFKAFRRPKVVVLSTHGYFLEDQDQARAPALAGLESRGLKLAALERPRPRGEKVQVLENPLLRCGLALAGANQRDKAPEGAEDGILTGLEIVGCDLRGTELVVLSACETGLGKVNVGEGVAGLRQAFQLAGAQAVVATLWQIPDTETTELMKAFFTHLAAKQGKAEALRQAQLDIIRKRRARGKAAHPFYWAAFTLTGQWR